LLARLLLQLIQGFLQNIHHAPVRSSNYTKIEGKPQRSLMEGSTNYRVVSEICSVTEDGCGDSDNVPRDKRMAVITTFYVTEEGSRYNLPRDRGSLSSPPST